MSDPYNRGVFGDPQSLSILSEVERRPRAQSVRSNQVARELETNGTNEALRKWGMLPTKSIQLAVTDYFKYKDIPQQLRQMEGVDDSFRVAQIYAGLWLTAGHHLRLNLLSDQTELDGTVVAGKEIGQLLLRNKGWVYGKLPTFEEIEVFAEQYKYSPVEQYLTGLPESEGNHLATLYEVGRIALGLTDELSLNMVAKTLIGAVARALSPGCEQQTCLVIQGPQGFNKTTFFKRLFGDEFFGHLDTSRDQRDWAMVMATKWCVELGELESFTSKKSSGMLKNFLSSATDTYRRPYDRKPRTVKRHSVCVGSVNVGCPLVDETGNRRYWMVSVGNHTNLAWVQENRDRIWAAAKALYDSGEPWWFDYETERIAMKRAEEYRQTDPWEEVLAEFLPAIARGSEGDDVQDPTVRAMLFRYEGGSKPTTNQLLEVLGIPLDRQGRSDQVRLGAVMEALGWKRSSASVNGVVKKVWRC